MKNNQITNFEIDKILNKKNIKNFHGCFMRDELTNNNFIKEGFYIINLNKSTESGSHWTVIYKDDKNYYFDSYGFVAPKEIEKIIKPYIYNNKVIQDKSSSSCGYYIIAFIMFMNDNKNNDSLESFDDFINIFINDHEYNEKTLYKLLKKYNIDV
jgi:hypothetical protein